MPTPSLPLVEATELLHLTSIETLLDFQETSDMATRIAEAEVLVKVIDKLFTVFQDPRALLDALHDCNCILSGQFVVNLLNPTHMPTIDCVDVLAGDDRFALFAHHLERNERGGVVAHVEDIPDFTPGSYKYAHIFTCAKSTVRLVRSNNDSPFYLVPHYPATHLMNYLTFDHLAVAYPTLTFAGKGVQVAGYIDNALAGNFTVDYRPLICDGDTCDTSAACGDRMRWFNDEESVSIGYGGMYSPHGLVHWCLGGVGCTVTCRSQPDRMVDFDP